MEYLFSTPGTIGGSIYMNAGRGKSHNKAISDKLVKAKVFDADDIFELNKEECRFAYRYSIFHKKSEWIILEATFELNDREFNIGEKKIKERIDYVKENQHRNYPNVGSIYKAGKSGKILKLLSYFKIGDCKFKGNWIINLGDGRAEDVLKLLKISKVLHCLVMKKPKLEVEIW